MAWYYGTFSCGHEGRVNIIGPTKLRRYKADKRFEGVCSDCWEKQLNEKIERENSEAEIFSKKMELPELEGTAKQIAWANTLRHKLLQSVIAIDFSNNELSSEIITIIKQMFNEDFVNIEDSLVNNFTDEMQKVIDYLMQDKTQATFYIENRDLDTEDRVILLICKMYKEIIDNKEKQIQDMKIQQVIKSGTVEPKKVLHEGIVELTSEDNLLKVFYIKDDDFIKIVKDFGCYWKGNCWRKNIYKTNGTIEDRMAELGNNLLNEGFRVFISNSAIREKAINGNYTKEHYRWIVAYGEDIKISWSGRNEKLYKIAKRIPTARYNKNLSNHDTCVIDIDINGYDELIEFAELYDFKFIERADKIVQQYLLEKQNIEKVEPVQVEKEPEKDGLSDILKSDNEIIDDLIDD